MKKIKILFLILIMFLLSGCTFEYNINVDKDVISENNIVYIEGTTFDNVESTFENMVSKYTGPTNSLGMYTSSIVKENDLFGISYQRDYSYRNYNYSISFSSCYDVYKMIEEDDKLIISTGKDFNCFDKYDELDEVVVNLTSNYYVEKSNADVVDGDKHMWYITKDNDNNKPINVTIDLTKPISNNKSSWLNAFTLTIISFAVVGLIIFLIFVRGKRKNKI